MTKNTLSILVFVLFLMSCNSFSKKNISIENTSKFNYVDNVISMPWEQITTEFSWVDGDNFKIINVETKSEIPYQIEYLGTENPVNLLLQVSLKSNEKINIEILQEKHSAFATKTYGRYVPERLDDFAWENDKIAFRMYGKALDQTPADNAFGMDVWVKRTDRMVVNERYKRGKYHEDLGDGMDYYKVGLTLGAGDCAPFLNDSVWYSKHYNAWKVLDNGPLRTTFELDFDPWDVAGKKLTATKTISLDAGSQLNKIEVIYNAATNETIPVAVGIIKRPEDGFELMNKEKGILGYWEPQHGDDGITGVGVIIPSKVNEMKLINEQYLAIAETFLNKPFIYYAGAAWNKAGVITTHQEWFDYLDAQSQQLSNNGIVIKFE